MKPMRVLFVDDEEELVSAVVERLELRGIEATGVTSGADALQEVERRELDVVVLDVKMPQLGGLGVIKRIKQLRPELQVVMLTGHGSSEDAAEGMRLGAFDYLQKPIDIEALLTVLRSAVTATSSADDSEQHHG